MASVVLKAPEPVAPDVVLTLSPEEASTLLTLLWCHVCGPTDGPRGVLDGISYAMCDAGVSVRPHLTSEAPVYLGERS